MGERHRRGVHIRAYRLRALRILRVGFSDHGQEIMVTSDGSRCKTRRPDKNGRARASSPARRQKQRNTGPTSEEFLRRLQPAKKTKPKRISHYPPPPPTHKQKNNTKKNVKKKNNMKKKKKITCSLPARDPLRATPRPPRRTRPRGTLPGARTGREWPKRDYRSNLAT